MGLDVYVGPLTRYYLGEWETVVQHLGREQGLEVSIERPLAPKRTWFESVVDRFRPNRRAAAIRAVRRWQQQLARQLRLPNIEWNDDPEGEYETDKPAWDSYGALMLWAAYEELSDAQALTGESIVVGSSLHLLAALKHLNSCTWAASDHQIRTWRYDGAKYGGSLETSAQFGFSIFFELAQRSVAARLPMKLDY